MSMASDFPIRRASHRPAKSRAARITFLPACAKSARAGSLSAKSDATDFDVQSSVKGPDKHPRFLDNSSVGDIDYMLGRLQAAERGSVPEVTRAVARRIGVAPGTVENLRRGRIKFVERVEARIRAAFVSLLESEIGRATHELETMRRAADRSDCAALRAAESALRRRVAEAQALIAPVQSEAAE